ncbi:MAG: type I methionyl aminopeptidase [Nitrospinaceae bacterium]|nr:type I methionyl aminopeptidase [Nitrospinaceae bacterium]NIR56999.1 type I methionyl aminopeptidase [Nitrospinaceae bacterium]NIS87456.1 type I methionyl aminopeptidase [Nitrospinaceae bacterium]NIT84305.1 type I methionyl aminopeptidase [Nitrospinaceae bacterium]NIU46495.1 type I methionyl aminopeptidase [Nitrospinaceae bacterium]
MVTIKVDGEIEAMRRSGKLAAEVLLMIEPYIKPGVTTNELNDLCHNYIVENGAIPAPLNYRGFPKSICTSVNEEICHGIPSDRKLRNGDMVNLDITTILDEFHGDTNKVFFVGSPRKQAKKLADATMEALHRAIEVVRPGARLGDIGATIQQYVEARGYSVVREFCGHGIGRKFHEDPQVLHFGKPGHGLVLEKGMTFTIEPMINLGKPDLKILDDNWTAVTQDGSLSAQYEHTILVTENGHEVLTRIEGKTSF